MSKKKQAAKVAPDTEARIPPLEGPSDLAPSVKTACEWIKRGDVTEDRAGQWLMQQCPGTFASIPDAVKAIHADDNYEPFDTDSE